MPEFIPFAGKNSIQEVVFGVHFVRKPESKKVEAVFNTLRAELATEFPQANVIQFMEMKVEAGAQGEFSKPQMVQQFGGFEMSRKKGDGKPSQMLRQMNDVLTANFMVYEQWEDTFPKAVQFLRRGVGLLDLAAVPASGFSLRYIDRFTFDGPNDRATADGLFKRDTSHLTDHCFDVGQLWHCYTGWFDSFKGAEKDGRVLNQLNIQSADIDEAPGVLIDHNAIFQYAAPRQSEKALFEPGDAGKVSIEQGLDMMHKNNKVILNNLLLPEILKKIGL